MQQLFAAYWGTYLLLAALVLLAGLLTAARTGRLLDRAPPLVWTAWSAGVLLIGAVQTAIYLATPNYVDYVEPMIAALSSNLAHGHPLYADTARGEGVMSSLYGPLIFQIQGLFLAIWPTILMSKAAGVAIAALNLALLLALLKTILRDWGRTLLVAALFLALVASFRHFWFWNRPDPVLILISTLALIAMTRLRPVAALVTIGVLAGLAANLRLYSPIFLVPQAIVCLALMPTWRLRIGSALVAGAVSLLVFAAPYVSPDIEFWPFLRNVLAAGSVGLRLDVVLGSLTYGVLLLAPPAVLLWKMRGAPGLVAERALFWGLAVTTVLFAVVTGKPGSGSPHLTSLAPISVVLLARLMAASQPSAAATALSIARIAAVATFVCVAPIWAYSFKEITDQGAFTLEHERAAEARALITAYPQAEMAPTFVADRSQYYRVLIGFQGEKIDFDATNWPDLRFAGASIDLVRPIIEGCQIPQWISTREWPPFAGVWPSDDLEFFDDRFRRRFAQNYRLVERRRYFDVWACSQASGPQDQVTVMSKGSGG